MQVSWGGMWFPATVLEGKVDLWHIRYDGYDESWDEWVGPDRIREPRSKTPSVQRPARAQTYYAVVLDTTETRAEAIRLAKQASSRLTIMIADETLETPPAQRTHLGQVITVAKPPAGFVVGTTSWLAV